MQNEMWCIVVAMSQYKFLLRTCDRYNALYAWTNWKHKTEPAYWQHLRVSYWIFRLAKQMQEASDWHFRGITNTGCFINEAQFSVQIASQDIIKQFHISREKPREITWWKIMDNNRKSIGGTYKPPSIMGNRQTMHKLVNAFRWHMNDKEFTSGS